MNKFGDTKISEHCTKEIKLVVKVIVTKLLTKWRGCNYTYDRFNNNHMKWIDNDLKLLEIQQSQFLVISTKTFRGK